ncbi:MAG: four helix bundle protein [Clostridia bacterium]|jgi:hypothetical protein|nr:four helix bundle protein [Clostridia bacterium]
MQNETVQLSLLDDEIANELASEGPNVSEGKAADGAQKISRGQGADMSSANPADSDNASDKCGATGQRSEFDRINNVSRAPFRIHDFDTPRDKEMAVFTHAKKLSEYIFVITEKSPKKLRWSIVSRLQNISTELIENLYRANNEREEAARLEYQKRASVCIDLLDFYAETAKRMKAINLHQMSVIARQTSDVNKLLRGWIKSGKRA